jgi:hypothetical protein
VQLRAPGARFVLPALALVLHELVKGGCESCSGTSSSGSHPLAGPRTPCAVHRPRPSGPRAPRGCNRRSSRREGRAPCGRSRALLYGGGATCYRHARACAPGRQRGYCRLLTRSERFHLLAFWVTGDSCARCRGQAGERRSANGSIRR